MKINVLDYGAVGDGETDDTAAIQRALDAAAKGDRLVFPPGVFPIKGNLDAGKARRGKEGVRWEDPGVEAHR